MEDRKEGNGWMSVPAFGDWEKNGVPDYSMDFSKIREMRKLNKNDFSRASLGNDDELNQRARSTTAAAAASSAGGGGGHHRGDLYGHLPHSPTANPGGDHSPTARKKFMSYFNCCIGV